MLLRSCVPRPSVARFCDCSWVLPTITPRFFSAAACSTATTISPKNGFEALITENPIVPLREVRSCRADMFGTKCSSSTAARTRSAIGAESRSGQLKKLDAVAADTPACRATS